MYGRVPLPAAGRCGSRMGSAIASNSGSDTEYLGRKETKKSTCSQPERTAQHCNPCIEDHIIYVYILCLYCTNLGSASSTCVCPFALSHT